MKKPIFIFLTIIFLVSASAITAISVAAQPKKGKTKPKPVVSASLKDDEIVAAFKDVLLSGVKRANAQLGVQGGFYNNPKFKISMPPALQALEKNLRGAGYGDIADDLVVAMNRAAEQSVGEAFFVLNDEARKMTVEDAKKLLSGPDDAVTQHFRRSGEKVLLAKTTPLVNTATTETGALILYKSMEEKNGDKITGFDIDKYVTQKTLDAMFLEIAAEEKRIREVPAARTTAALKKVFGN
ncbi:MAG TPA: DUF4197 domain-containing protein [Pyrinomonadaceae bacterium]|jgi:hypothetical protein|nr:DUF4197 domain-containing protein [Pyrinomonadaceae bacterium]